MEFRPSWKETEEVKRTLESVGQDRWLIEQRLLPPRYEDIFRRETTLLSSHHSTRIEGNPLTESEAAEALRGGAIAQRPEGREKVNYVRALDLVEMLAQDSSYQVDEGLLRGLNLLVLDEIPGKVTRGQYRRGQNWVEDPATRQRVYLPPDQGDVPELMAGLVQWLRSSGQNVHPVVGAAVAHQHLVAIHPFDDGNGRCARLLTNFVLTRGGYGFRRMLAVERYIDEHSATYYRAISACWAEAFVQEPDITPFVTFFAIAVEAEAERLRTRITDFMRTLDEARERTAARVAEVIVDLAPGMTPKRIRKLATGALRERHLISYAYAVGTGRAISRRDYEEIAGVSGATAMRDLEHLVRVGAFRVSGRGRATRYIAVRPESVQPRA